MKDPYNIPDPFWSRVHDALFKHVICPVRGHRTITKFSGTVLCKYHR